MKNRILNLWKILTFFLVIIFFISYCDQSTEPGQKETEIKDKVQLNHMIPMTEENIELICEDFKDLPEQMQVQMILSIKNFIKDIKSKNPRIQKALSEAETISNSMKINSGEPGFRAIQSGNQFYCEAIIYANPFEYRKWYLYCYTTQQFFYLGYTTGWYGTEVSFTITSPPPEGYKYAVWVDEYDSELGYTGVPAITPYIIFDEPNAPSLSTPPNGATGIGSNVTCTWNAATGTGEVTYVLDYNLQVDNNSNFSSPHTNPSGLTSRTYNVTGLLLGYTNYYWRVRAHNLYGYGPYSSSRTFTTTVFAAPQQVLPANNSTTSGSNVTLQWNAVTGSNILYELEVYKGTTLIPTLDDLPNTYYTLNNLDNNTTYKWKVRGYNGSCTGSWSTNWYFTTPATSLNPPAINGTTYNNHPKITWNSISGATGYKIYRRDPGNTTYYLAYTTSATSKVDNMVDLSFVPGGTKGYLYYKVKAYNASGASEFSNSVSYFVYQDMIR
ncbi:MAG: fibronectin type III domain-containing protein [Calditrichaceae bacterium]|nr:fibronectin type III domain-containing protein [Calditrichaceae bacterium]MBN2708800.1 fibronectin type III domain-containing protein [Calditrichaceae bacterium]RQV97671.1 MAG: fibronectin type III domain-containing protein [Calditrichota bacterium]